MKKHNFSTIPFLLVILIFVLACFKANAVAEQTQSVSRLLSLIEEQDSVYLTDQNGMVIASKNAEKLLVPASAIKILTALVAIHYLGEDFRFSTECYVDGNQNVKIKGYGDPLLVSEVMPDFARNIKTRIDHINDLVLDDTAFHKPLRIPGVSRTKEPYDAPNGAISANFNTVSFKETVKGKFISLEPQTPLVPFALSRIRSSGVDSGRIVFTHSDDESALYAGHLMAWFLNQNGVSVKGRVRTGLVESPRDRFLCRFISPYSLTEVIARLMDFSNNFIANQLFVVSGIKAYGLPGTMDKGIKATQEYLHNILKLKNIQIVEGSGISRENKISALNLDQLLVYFSPFHYLMKSQNGEFYKTGTLSDVRTRAGYIDNGKGGYYRFVVMINTPGKTADKAMEVIRRLVSEKDRT